MADASPRRARVSVGRREENKVDADLVKVICAALGPSAACVIVAYILSNNFTAFLKNHMSENSRCLKDVASTLGKLTGVIESCPRRGRGEGD